MSRRLPLFTSRQRFHDYRMQCHELAPRSAIFGHHTKIRHMLAHEQQNSVDINADSVRVIHDRIPYKMRGKSFSVSTLVQLTPAEFWEVGRSQVLMAVPREATGSPDHWRGEHRRDDSEPSVPSLQWHSGDCQLTAKCAPPALRLLSSSPRNVRYIKDDIQSITLLHSSANNSALKNAAPPRFRTP